MSDQPFEQPKNDNVSGRKVRRLFAVLALLLVMTGQTILFTSPVREEIGFLDTFENPDFLWINAAVVLLIAGVIVFVLSHIFEPPTFLTRLVDRFPLPGATTWIVAAIILSVFAAASMVAFEKAQRTNFMPVVTLWLFAGMCYLTAFLQGSFTFARFTEWVKQYRYELLAVGLLTLLAIILRFYKLGEIPRVINGDEGRVGIAAMSTYGYPYVNPFALWENFGALYLQIINVLLVVFGASPFSLRFIAAAAGVLAIPGIYLLARQITGQPRIAVIAAALLAISHTHIHFSRTVTLAYIQGAWLIPLELYFLLSGLANRSSWRAALGGMVLAIHYSIYLDAQIITALIFVYMVIAFIFLRSWILPALRQVAVFWGGFAIMILPELTYIQQHTSEFFDRMNRDGLFQSGWLEREIANTGRSMWEIVAQRVVHVFFSLNYINSFDFYGTELSILNLLSAALFLLGLGIALVKTRENGFLLLNGYFWAGLLSIGIFSIPASADSYRLTIVLPAVFIISAVGLDIALGMLGWGWQYARTTYVGVTSVILISLLAFNVWAYFINFAGKCLFGGDDPPARFASYLGNYAREIDRSSTIYLLSDDIFFHGAHQSIDFLSHNRPIINFNEPADNLQTRPGEVVIATPNRFDELQTWADTHPGGRFHVENDCNTVILLAYQFP